MKNEWLTIKRALLSVSDKSYIVELGKSLHAMDVEILATGGTAAELKRNGIPFVSIDEYAQSPEVFDGRIKTLTFRIQGGILFDRGNPKHVKEAQENKVLPIDCVVCNFYPFEDAALKLKEKNTESDSIDELIEWIDVGGPSMVRAAAKNYKNVLVLTQPQDYEKILSEMKSKSGSVSLATRKEMMIKAFGLVQCYDQAIYEEFAKKDLRYGENPHQNACFVPTTTVSRLNWGSSLDGDTNSNFELSYNNILDAHAAFGAMNEVAQTAATHQGVCAIVKHNNPCGLATAPTIVEAFERAWACDPVSSFGGVVSLSAPLTMECAMLFKKKFIEVLIAPGFEEGVVEELRREKKKLRFIRSGKINEQYKSEIEKQRLDVEGGVLVQWPDQLKREELQSMASIKFPKNLHALSQFGIVGCKWLKSNAIAIAHEMPDGGFELIGAGSGQPNRVDAVQKLALPKALTLLTNRFKGDEKKAREVLGECVLISDAFFPFPDSVEIAHAFGIRHIVQPGGSIKDNEVIEACNRLGLTMAFTGRRHFRH